MSDEYESLEIVLNDGRLIEITEDGRISVTSIDLGSLKEGYSFRIPAKAEAEEANLDVEEFSASVIDINEL